MDHHWNWKGAEEWAVRMSYLSYTFPFIYSINSWKRSQTLNLEMIHNVWLEISHVLVPLIVLVLTKKSCNTAAAAGIILTQSTSIIEFSSNPYNLGSIIPQTFFACPGHSPDLSGQKYSFWKKCVSFQNRLYFFLLLYFEWSNCTVTWLAKPFSFRYDTVF